MKPCENCEYRTTKRPSMEPTVGAKRADVLQAHPSVTAKSKIKSNLIPTDESWMVTSRNRSDPVLGNQITTGGH